MSIRFPGFQECMNLIRKQDWDAEEGYSLLSPYARKFLPNLVEELSKPENKQVKSWIIELISLANTQQSMVLLKDILLHDADPVSSWSITGLMSLNTPELLDLLETVELYELEYPDAAPDKLRVWELFKEKAARELANRPYKV